MTLDDLINTLTTWRDLKKVGDTDVLVFDHTVGIWQDIEQVTFGATGTVYIRSIEPEVAQQITLEDAKRVVAERSNGALIGTSPSKGGRAWLDGEWCLAELEGLCIMLRHEAGDAAEGAAEVLAFWKDM